MGRARIKRTRIARHRHTSGGVSSPISCLFVAFFFLDTPVLLQSPLLPSADSMIRVGGDYQAQIPEFKPGKQRRERRKKRGEKNPRLWLWKREKGGKRGAFDV